jgi:hypothetical protein
MGKHSLRLIITAPFADKCGKLIYIQIIIPYIFAFVNGHLVNFAKSGDFFALCTKGCSLCGKEKMKKL